MGSEPGRTSELLVKTKVGKDDIVRGVVVVKREDRKREKRETHWDPRERKWDRITLILSTRRDFDQRDFDQRDFGSTHVSFVTSTNTPVLHVYYYSNL